MLGWVVTWNHVIRFKLFVIRIVTWSCNCLPMIINITVTPLEFFTSVLADGLTLEFEWQQVSRTLLSILAVLNNAVVWMVSSSPPSSKSSGPFNSPLVTVPINVPITIGIIVTFMFHSFLNPQQGLGTYPSFHFRSVLFSGPPGEQSSQFCKLSFFVVDYHKVWSSGQD